MVNIVNQWIESYRRIVYTLQTNKSFQLRIQSTNFEGFIYQFRSHSWNALIVVIIKHIKWPINSLTNRHVAHWNQIIGLHQLMESTQIKQINNFFDNVHKRSRNKWTWKWNIFPKMSNRNKMKNTKLRVMSHESMRRISKYNCVVRAKYYYMKLLLCSVHFIDIKIIIK